jgi:hypothetical protein
MIAKNGCNIARRCALFPAGIFALLLRTTIGFGQSVPDAIAVSPQSVAPASEDSPTSVDANTDATLPVSESSSASVQADSRETGYSSVPRRFHYNFDLTLRAGSDDNINLSHTDRQSDSFYEIAPVLTLGFGDFVTHEENFLRVDFAPSWVGYVNHAQDNAIQEVFRLTGQYRFSRLTLSLGQSVDSLDGAETETAIAQDSVNSRLNLDVSGRTRRNIYITNLGATYDLSDKNFLSAGLGYSASDYVNLISYQQTSANLYINYRYSPKLVVGIGVNGGLELVDPPTPDQTFEQANLRLTYEAGGKLSFTGLAGVEVRQFKNTSAGQYISPVFTLQATYRPFDGTEVTFDALHQTEPSAVSVGQDFSTSTLSIEVHQRLLSRIRLGLSVGYETAQYFSAVTGVNTTRQDNYYFVEPTVDIAVTRYWALGGFYLRQQNATSDGSYSFYDSQIGFRSIFKF